MSDKPFFVRLYASAAEIKHTLKKLIEAHSVLTILPIEHPEPFPTSFDTVAVQLSSWSEMQFEPDGSFVWCHRKCDRIRTVNWQLDGMIYDNAGQIQYVELKGFCDFEAWHKLVGCLYADNSNLVRIHFVDRDVWVDRCGFESYLQN